LDGYERREVEFQQMDFYSWDNCLEFGNCFLTFGGGARSDINYGGVVFCELESGFFTQTTASLLISAMIWLQKSGDIPPVIRMTFPERSGVSVSGLNLSPRNILGILDF
jgi:hypothetical protein